MLRVDGSSDELSILSIVQQAEDIRAIVGDVKPQAFSLHRLLLAIIHRALDGPNSVDEWVELNGDWAEVAASVEDYLGLFEERFDLCHPTQPFYQVAGLHTAKGEVSGLEKIIVDVPNGSPYFTTRVGEGIEQVSLREAARWLVHVQAFDTSGIKSGAVGDPRVKGGKGYPIGVAWAGQLDGVEVIGSTLRETLMLNLVPTGVPGIDIKTGVEDRPPWERTQLTSQEDGSTRPPRGFVDLYTWQSRRVLLHGDLDSVTGVVLANGDKITPQNKHTVEPMSLWRYSEPQSKKFGDTVYMPGIHDPSKLFWRGLASMLPDTPREGVKSAPAPVQMPAVLKWIDALRFHRALPSNSIVRVHSTGYIYGSQSAVVDELFDDVLAFPSALLSPENAALRLVALNAVDQTDRGVFALVSLARNLAAAAGAGDLDGFGDRAREQVYALLDAPFRAWLTTLNLVESESQAAARWHSQAREMVRGQADQLVRSVGPAAWRGREVSGRHVDVGQAEIWFGLALTKAFPRAFDNRQELAR